MGTEIQGPIYIPYVPGTHWLWWPRFLLILGEEVKSELFATFPLLFCWTLADDLGFSFGSDWSYVDRRLEP